MRIIPAIDIIDGKCVRLSKGDFETQKTYYDDPLEVAKILEAHGVKYLHLVDLDGARSHKIVNYRILEKIATKTALKIDFGGGLKSDADLKIAFENGAVQVTGGSVAVNQPETFMSWLERYGSDQIILGADARDRKVSISGWLEDSELEIAAFVQSYLDRGVSYVISTDISRDGMLSGPSFELYRDLVSMSGSGGDIKLIASGGIASVDDLYRLKETGCEGAILGKAIYEGRITFKALEKYILEN